MSSLSSSSPVPSRSSPRNVSVDLLRGLVMVLMALDHVRDYVGSRSYDPADLDATTPALFLTRWVTHYCAPVFVFLAGTAVQLSGARGKSTGELRRFLFTRGLWLILLEMTVVRFCWLFSLSYASSMLQVIWAIGASMVVLSLFLGLPLRVIGALGAAMILLHDALDGVHVAGRGALHVLWSLLHEMDFGWEPLPNKHVFIIFPLVPWVGVMMLGYACGAWMQRPAEERQRLLLRSGLAAVAAFVVLRASNLYGDPDPWSSQPRGPLFTLFSFLNVHKYPPSLCYLLMTLGPALVALALFEKMRVREAGKGLGGALVVFGRVPLFYYVAHIALAHAIGLYFAHTKLGLPLDWNSFERHVDWGLGAVYVVWLSVVIALYPLCKWYARTKGSAVGRTKTVLSYL